MTGSPIQAANQVVIRAVLLVFVICAAAVAADAPQKADVKTDSKIIKTLHQGIPHAAFFGISFDAGKGIAVGLNGAIYQSADAGLTWKEVKHGLTEMAFLAVDKRGTQTIAVGQAGLVAIEESPGKWTKVALDTPKRLFSVSIGQNGFVAAVGEFGTVLKSTDGGRSWSSMTPDWASYADADSFGTGEPNVYAVNVADSGEITIAGEFGLILRSADSGATWKVLRPVTAGVPTLFALHIPRDGVGNSYAVGQTGELLVSPDQGLSWNKVANKVQSNFLGVAVSGAQVVLTGMRVMVRSVDSGQTWKEVEEGDTTTDWYQAVRTESGSGRIMAVGHSGRIIQIGG